MCLGNNLNFNQILHYSSQVRAYCKIAKYEEPYLVLNHIILSDISIVLIRTFYLSSHTLLSMGV